MIGFLLSAIFTILLGYNVGIAAAFVYVFAGVVVLFWGLPYTIPAIIAAVYFDLQWWYYLFLAQSIIVGECHHLMREKVLEGDMETATDMRSGIWIIELLGGIAGTIALGGLIYSMM